MKIVKLDKVLNAGTTYVLESDRAYVIEAIGTNSAARGRIYIDEVPLTEIDSTVAPMHVTSTNLLGPLKLGDLSLVVPPDKRIRFEGDSGSKLRIIGKLILLDSGESLPGGYLDRFRRQGDHYWTTVSGTQGLGTNEAWKNGAEITVITLHPATIEMYRLNNYLGVSVTGGSFTEGELGIRFKFKEVPFDVHSVTEGPLGIDVKSAPLPPSSTTESVPFMMSDFPFDVPGDTTFTIGVINTSGSDKSPSSGSAWSVTVKAIVEYVRT